MEGFENTAEQNTEHEFDIGTREGLRRFLEYVEDAHEAIRAGAEGDETSDSQRAGEAAYEKLRQLISDCEQVLERGEEVSDEAIATLQSLYDEMWKVADELAALEADAPAVAEASEETTAPVEETMNGTVTIEEAEGAPSIEPLDETISDERFATARERSEELRVRAAALVKEYETSNREHPDANLFNAMAYYYDELTKTALRIETIVNTLASSRAQETLTVLEFTHIEDRLEEVEENLDELERGIERILHPTEAVSSALEEEISISKPATGALSVAAEEKGVQSITIKTPPPAPAPVAPPSPARPQVTPTRIESLRPRAEKGVLRSELAPLIEGALKEQRYASFVAQAFGSGSDFETAVLRRIGAIETPSKLDTVFGIAHESAFHSFLKDMTVTQLETFDRQPREQLRQTLLEKNIEYEVYVKWLEAFYDMLQMLRIPTAMTFGELFVRAELEELMHHYYAHSREM